MAFKMVGDFKIPPFKENWKEAWSSKSYRKELIGSILFIFVFWKFIFWFFPYIQSRTGAVINDPILNMLTPMDLSWFTFICIYLVFISAMIHLMYHPRLLLVMFEVFLVVTTMRMLSLFFIPLDPPKGIILLTDPIIGKFAYNNNVITKDLFFSGHTVLVFVMFLVVRHTWLKISYLILTICVGCALMIQHVHYSFDVMAAPIFTYLAFKIVKLVHR
ncbi:MAG: phosphatase PAP2-related protein [Bacteroidota bacterium]